MIFAPGNRNESPLIREAIAPLKNIAKSVGFNIKGSIMSLDGVYDCRENRKKIFNAGMKPNINPNKRNRKKNKRGRKPIFNLEIFKERFRTIERVFAWEDKFKRLLMRFERISSHHYGMKCIAFALINLRHFCSG
jgi:Transposase DDE domain